MSGKDDLQINIHDIYNKPGQMREFAREVVLGENWGEGLAAVQKDAALSYRAKVESVHEGILVTLEAETTVTAECSRCLTEFAETLEVDFVELFAYNVTETDEYGVHGDHVDLEPPLRDAVVLALPFNPVCRESCYGLDPVTGQRLTSAVAEPAEAVDPRLAVLADLLVTQDSGQKDKETK